MRSCNIGTEFIPISLKKQKKWILKSLEILDKVDPKDTKIDAPSIIDRYENRPDNLDICSADSTANYIYKKADINYEPDDEKS